MKIGQYGVGTQLTDGFVTMADAMLVAIGVVYLLLVLLVTLFALPLVVVGGFVSLAATARALGLSALIVLLMLRSIVGTNAIVLLTLVQHKIETGDDVRTVIDLMLLRAYAGSTPRYLLPTLVVLLKLPIVQVPMPMGKSGLPDLVARVIAV